MNIHFYLASSFLDLFGLRLLCLLPEAPSSSLELPSLDDLTPVRSSPPWPRSPRSFRLSEPPLDDEAAMAAAMAAEAAAADEDSFRELLCWDEDVVLVDVEPGSFAMVVVKPFMKP